MNYFGIKTKTVCMMALGFLIVLPLGIWKLIEILIWVFNHMHISIN
jgi:hypothetical protein|nr:MAG TPA: Protein of unknown function (DUF2852) [Caudoviricetes sp.]